MLRLGFRGDECVPYRRELVALDLEPVLALCRLAVHLGRRRFQASVLSAELLVGRRQLAALPFFRQDKLLSRGQLGPEGLGLALQAVALNRDLDDVRVHHLLFPGHLSQVL